MSRKNPTLCHFLSQQNRQLQEIPVSETKTITQTIDGQQVDRTYLIRYPSEVTKASYPVVFFFMVQEVMVKDGLVIVLRLKI